MTIIARNKVRDVEAFLQGHQERVDLFAPATSSWQNFQDADDPQSVVLIIEVTDMAKFQAILHDPQNAVLSAKHTVIQPIIVSMPAAG